MKLHDWVYNWFISNTGITREQLEEHATENFFDLGWLDSFQYIKLLSDLEELNVTLTNDQFENRRFATIAGMIDILEEK